MVETKLKEEVNITDEFIESLFELNNILFDKQTLIQVKRCLIDYTGVTLAGARILEKKLNNYIHSVESDCKVSKPIGFHSKTTLENAVVVNGMASHVAELDDGVRFGMIHPGSPLFSALIPVAKLYQVEVNDFIRAVIVGYETSVRLAMSIAPSHYNLGFHPTATCGTIGVAAGVSSMLGFSKAHMKDAISAAVISSSGSLKVIEDTSQIKPFNVARAALVGYTSAQLARAGFAGPNDALGGQAGFINMMAEFCDLNSLLRNKKDKLLIHSVYNKPYAACRHAHAPIEAAISLRKKHSVRIEDIDVINVYTYKSVIGKHDHSEIFGAPSAKMSIPYGVAVSFITGSADLEKFTDAWCSKSQILNLTSRVKVIEEELYSSLVPEKRCARVEIIDKQNNKYQQLVEFPKGEPENSMTNSEINNKYSVLAEFAGVPKDIINEQLSVIWNMEDEWGNYLRKF